MSAMTASGNARWIALIQMSRVGVQLLCITVLSRLLAPGDFGLVAMAMAVTNLGNLLRDLGIASAIIQKPKLDERTLATAFWMCCGVGFTLGLIFVLSAPLVAMLMHEPDVAGLMRVLAAMFPMYGIAIVQQALLERNGRFATVARVEITSAVAGLGVALIAAMSGAGAMSLAFQSLTIACAASLQFIALAEWKPRLGWGRSQFRELWQFGGHVSGSNVVNYLARNLDSAIIGRVLGAASLGPYSIAYRIMLFPLYNLTFVATRALFPVMSRAADTGHAAKRDVTALFLRALSVIAFFSAPLMTGLFVLRDPFVNVFLGARWHSVAVLIAWLAPTGLVQSLISPCGSVFMALGRPNMLVRIGGIGACLCILSFIVGVQWGVVEVTQCYFVASLAAAALWFGATLHAIQCSARRLFAAIYRPLLMALVMAAAVAVLKPSLDATVPQSIRLVVLVAAGVLLYGAMAIVMTPAILRDVRSIVVGKTRARASARDLAAQQSGAP
ncbi:MAG: lipopolysaccharide biosynthesis protein [Steroidobacteraceae bacterium]